MASILDAITGISYPTRTVDIYVAFELLAQLGEIENEISFLGNSAADKKRLKELETQQTKLIGEIQDQKWSFTLQGLPSEVVKTIFKKNHRKIKEAYEATDATNREVVIRSVAKATAPGGEQVEFTDEQLGQFLDALPSAIEEKFVNTVNLLSEDSVRYEYKVTDPNFS